MGVVDNFRLRHMSQHCIVCLNFRMLKSNLFEPQIAPVNKDGINDFTVFWSGVLVEVGWWFVR